MTSPSDQLHAAIVYDHVVVLYLRVLFGHFARSLQEQTVGELHNISFVYCGYL
jgi:hypothetical protein